MMEGGGGGGVYSPGWLVTACGLSLASSDPLACALEIQAFTLGPAHSEIL